MRAVRRLAGLLMACALLLGLSGCEGASDLSYEQLRDSAIAAEESAAFEIGWRACELPEDEQTQPHGHWIQYDLVLVPKKEMRDVHFAAHLPEKAASVLVNAQWHNEPQTITGAILYTWNPCVRIEKETPLDTIQLSDFTEMVLEIRWKGGRETVFVDMNCQMPQNLMDEMDAYAPLSQREIEKMQERARTSE